VPYRLLIDLENPNSRCGVRRLETSRGLQRKKQGSQAYIPVGAFDGEKDKIVLNRQRIQALDILVQALAQAPVQGHLLAVTGLARQPFAALNGGDAPAVGQRGEPFSQRGKQGIFVLVQN